MAFSICNIFYIYAFFNKSLYQARKAVQKKSGVPKSILRSLTKKNQN